MQTFTKTLIVVSIFCLTFVGCRTYIPAQRINWDEEHSSSIANSEVTAIDRFTFEDMNAPDVKFERSQLAVLAAHNTGTSGDKYFVLFAPSYGDSPSSLSLTNIDLSFVTSLTPTEYTAVLSLLEKILAEWDMDIKSPKGVYYEYNTSTLTSFTPTTNTSTTTKTNIPFDWRALNTSSTSSSNLSVPGWLSSFHVTYNRTSKEEPKGGSLFSISLGDKYYRFAFTTQEKETVRKFYETAKKAQAELKAMGMP